MLHKTAKTVKEYIAAHNMRAAFYTASAEGRWMSEFAPAEHFEEWYGITTVEQFVDMLHAEHEKEVRKASYYDYYEDLETERLAREKENYEANKVKYCNDDTPLTQNPFADLEKMLKKG